MQKTATKAKSSSSYTRPTLQKSTTLSRKYVRRPGTTKKISDVKKTNVQKVAKVEARPARKIAVAKKDGKEPEVAFKTKAKAAELSEAISLSAEKTTIKIKPVEKSPSIQRFKEDKAGAKKDAPVKEVVSEKVVAEPKTVKSKSTEPSPKKVVDTKRSSAKLTKLKSAKAIKTKEANRAASDAARAAMRGLATAEAKSIKKQHRGRRVILAFGCTAAVVAALGAFVMVNMPNISVKVAAMQTGIDASYPEVVPRNYTMETVASSKDGTVTMKFVNPDGSSFVLTEEKSTWDSTAVLNNYVKTEYSANYSTMHEQGITYYTESGSAVWVNGGILYKITSSGKNLTREQIRNLVASL